jgi:hypothetical protein
MVLWWCLSVAARAGDASSVAAAEPVPPDTAEYTRLSQELEVLTSKNAWAGVERTFQELLATGVEPSHLDWYRGAQSARVIGDTGEARARLEHAKGQGKGDERAIIDLMWDIDTRYGHVFLACDPGSYITLRAASMPFDPDLRRSIEFAEAKVRDECFFDGLLPAGDYTFFDHTVQVVPKVMDARIDLRGIEIDRKKKKQLRKEWGDAGGTD